MALLPLIGGIASGIIGGLNKSKQLKNQQKANEKAAALSFTRQKQIETQRWKQGRSDIRLQTQATRNLTEQSGRIGRQAADQQHGFDVDILGRNQSFDRETQERQQGYTQSNMGLEQQYTQSNMNLGSDLRIKENQSDWAEKGKFAELQTELENRLNNLNQQRARDSFNSYGNSGRLRTR